MNFFKRQEPLEKNNHRELVVKADQFRMGANVGGVSIIKYSLVASRRRCSQSLELPSEGRINLRGGKASIDLVGKKRDPKKSLGGEKIQKKRGVAKFLS